MPLTRPSQQGRSFLPRRSTALWETAALLEDPKRACLQPGPDLSAHPTPPPPPAPVQSLSGLCRQWGNGGPHRVRRKGPHSHTSWGSSLGSTQGRPETGGPGPDDPGPGPADLRLLASGGHRRPRPAGTACPPQLPQSPGEGSWVSVLQRSLPRAGVSAPSCRVPRLTPQPAPSGPPSPGQGGPALWSRQPCQHMI